jgi:hypothetical protein
LAQAVPTANASLATPNNTVYLDELCKRVEKSILLNAFGLSMYNELQLALADINNPLYASYKKLVEGDEYDGKLWKGLNNDFSLIAFKVFEVFLTETDKRLSANGVVQAKTEASEIYSPAYKIATASQEFYKGYQSGFLQEPIIDGNFIDWFGDSDDVEISLYSYMVDKKEDFPLFDINKFRIYDELDQLNSFGI